MFKEFALQWPVLRQIFQGGDGTGPEAMSDLTKNLRPKNEGAKVARSVCPYCAVGCGQLVFHENGKMISIEGDPESPISRGRLCPKGADSFELLTHSKRLTKIKYRRAFSKEWEDLDLDKAMDAARLGIRNYPREFSFHTQLALYYADIGQFEEELLEGQEALRLQPGSENPYRREMDAYMSLDRPNEAKQVARRANGATNTLHCGTACFFIP